MIHIMDSPEPTPRERVCPPTPLKKRSTISGLDSSERERVFSHLSPRMTECLLCAYFSWKVDPTHEGYTSLLDEVPDLNDQVKVLVSQAFPGMDEDDWTDFATMAVNNPEVCTHLINQLSEYLPVHSATRSLEF